MSEFQSNQTPPNPYAEHELQVNLELGGATNPNDLSRPLYDATFGQAIKRFFKQYAKFSGRASRSEYWWAYLFNAIITIIPTIIFFVGFAMAQANTVLQKQCDLEGDCQLVKVTKEGANQGPAMALLVIGGLLMLLYGLAVIIPTIAIAWRRLHDANLPGPLWFIGFTYIGSIVLIVLLCLPPKPEGRRFDVQ